jgi:MYXO-CTERM domain-containing protein
VNARVDNGTNNLTGLNFVTSLTSGGTGASIVLSNVQFNGGNGFVGVGGVNGTYSGSSQNNYYNLSVVPAPGAVALLGAAGLVGGRRRRA